MEEPPRLDASAPSGLRLVGFVITVVATLLAGMGAIQTWVTVGFRSQPGISPAIPGVDLLDGKIVLGCAVVLLFAIMETRLLRTPSGRKVMAVVVLVAGLVVLAVAGAFLVNASTRFDPVNSQDVAKALADTLGVPLSQIEATLADTVAKLGGFTEVGIGVYLALIGGIFGFLGGLLTLAWTTRIGAPEAPEAHARADETEPKDR